MKCFITGSLLFWAGICFSQQIGLDHRPSDHLVVVTANGKPFTSFYYPGPDLIKKPVLFPVYSPGGSLVTRGWPLTPRPGERVDHPHHIGVWFNYEDVNGNDFWNHSVQAQRPGKRYGTILNTRIVRAESGLGKGVLVSESDWVDQTGEKLLTDRTSITFQVIEDAYVIDYEINLHALQEVAFRDVKDGMFAFRLARELELKYDTPQTLTDASGKVSPEKSVDNSRVTGSYFNKEGVKNDDVWGKPSAWCAMSGEIDGDKVTVALMDHPANFGFPGYWHARGYGLFALNSVGRQPYDKTSAPLKFGLGNGEDATFRYRVVIASEWLTGERLNDLQMNFSGQQ